MADKPNSKIYLYLARRDRKGIKVLTTFRGHAVPPTRVSDLRHLGLNQSFTNQLEAMVEEEKLLWEPWVEAAESFADLQKSLRNRGYMQLPRKADVLFFGKNSLSNLRGLDKTRPSDRVQTNRVTTRRTMLGG